MLIKVHSVTTEGLNPVHIDVEVTSTTGIPQIIIIGLVTTSIKEAKDRIVTALKVLGIRLKARRTIVSLTPSDIKKTGSSFDLAIAVALVCLYREIKIPLEKTAFIGEISLDGSINAVTGCLGKVIAAKKLGYQSVVVPAGNINELEIVDGIKVFGLHHLSQVLNHGLSDLKQPATYHPATYSKKNITIVGQTEAVRALTIAVAGKHHLHLVGPPGVGKSTLPNFGDALQPELSQQAALEMSSIYSLTSMQAYNQVAPFRKPHHTSTLKKIVGYDSQLLPGEISLAHNGILFLDELPLFSTSVLQALRTPMDQKNIVLKTREKNCTFPCDCIFLASSNPCPCGFWQTGIKTCACSISARNAYQKKITLPLLERFDLHISISALKSDEYDRQTPQYNSNDLATKIVEARKSQEVRYKSTSFHNCDLRLASIDHSCHLAKDSTNLLKKAVTSYNLSTRGYEKVVAVAQTIADLEKSTTITQDHIAEALQYRLPTI